jgi:hypothetical protein
LLDYRYDCVRRRVLVVLVFGGIDLEVLDEERVVDLQRH